MTVLLVLFTILFFLGMDFFVQKTKGAKGRFLTKPEIYYHPNTILATPTMADGGELYEGSKEQKLNELLQTLTDPEKQPHQYMGKAEDLAKDLRATL